ncbi:unnamed protein product [Citrullus colocynthis]|uniref:N-acetyltransferase domain-containing protein n=1 Tax=Citrullus colocynthis TaxID=252529 RepID=A0ABP0YIF7_9ROSI
MVSFFYLTSRKSTTPLWQQIRSCRTIDSTISLFSPKALREQFSPFRSMNSSRISVRPFNLSDANDFLRWTGDDRVTRYLRWNTITCKEEALNYLKKVAIPHPWRRSIYLDGRSVGYVSVKQESEEKCRAHISYAVAADHWGRGIATMALRLAIPAALREFPEVVRVQALVEVENEGSQRVLKKLGFCKEGLLRKYGFCKGEIRDLVVFSFLRTDQLT